MALLLTYLFLALGISFLCSVLEAVLLSVNAPYIAALQQEGRLSGARLHKLKADIDRPLAAILSFNTIAHTAGAAGVGAQAAHVFSDSAVGVASAVMTLLILVFSEIIPKTLGASYWRQLAPAVSQILGPLIFMMWPLVQLSRGISRLIGSSESEAISREEVSAMAELGAAQGVLAEREQRVLRNLFELESLAVEHIMTPRTVVLALPAEHTVDEFMDRHPNSPFSRMPLFRGSLDDIDGYVLRDDVLLRAAKGEGETKLAELRRPLKVVWRTMRLPQLFEEMLADKAHIALVVDDFGSTAGVVSMEDVLETLIGSEIVDEADHVTDMQQLARKAWERRARKHGLLRDDQADTTAADRGDAEAAANAARAVAGADEKADAEG